jgi:hypothetical protein
MSRKLRITSVQIINLWAFKNEGCDKPFSVAACTSCNHERGPDKPLLDPFYKEPLQGGDFWIRIKLNSVHKQNLVELVLIESEEEDDEYHVRLMANG